jgi:hypothetical protein
MTPSTATTERSFSVLKRVKTYLRATMGQERLSDLALSTTYSQPGDIQLPLDAVVDTFNISDKETAFYLVVCKHPLHY